MSTGQWQWIGLCAFLGAWVAFFAGLEPARIVMDAGAGALVGVLGIEVWAIIERR